MSVAVMLGVFSPLLGLTYFSMAVKAFQTIQPNSPDIIRNGWTWILCLGAMLLTTFVSFIICQYRKNKCSIKNIGPMTIAQLFITLIISIGVIVLCSLMVLEYNSGNSTELLQEDSQNELYLYFIISTSGFLTLYCLANLGLIYRKKSVKIAHKEAEEERKNIIEREKQQIESKQKQLKNLQENLLEVRARRELAGGIQAVVRGDRPI